MLKRAIIFFWLACFTSSALAFPADGQDPSAPANRKSCGRLVISIVGAGEDTTNPPASMDSTVPGDKHAFEASGHLLQFTSNDQARLPSKHIVITSDPEIKSRVTSWPFSRKVSLAGVVDNSLPAFADMVSSASTSSPLNKALAEFKKDCGCEELMKLKETNRDSGAKREWKDEDILPFLKIDLIIDGELAESGSVDESGHYYHGVSSFKETGTVGTTERWLRDETVLGKREFSSLMERLSGSLMHVFIKTCKAGLIGNVVEEAMANKGICGCYVATSDEGHNTFRGKGVEAPFNYAMDDPEGYSKPHGRRFGIWATTDTNIINMAPLLLDRYKVVIMDEQDSAIIPNTVLRNMIFRRNPLFGFVYTSADALTNKALALLQNDPTTASIAAKVAYAEFTDEIHELDVTEYKTGNSAATEFDLDVERIRAHLKEARDQLGSVVDDNPRGKLDARVYTAETEKFNNCFADIRQAPEYCGIFKEWFESITAKVASKGGSSSEFTSDERHFGPSYNIFMKYLKEIHFSTMWPRYIAKEIELNAFLTQMKEAKQKFFDFKRAVEPIVNNDLGAHPSKKQKQALIRKQKAFKFLNEAFEAAYYSASSQVFALLKTESITTKMKRTEAAVNLLAQNKDSLKPAGEAEKLIDDLASKLNCLTRYSVGPHHDQAPAGPIVLYVFEGRNRVSDKNRSKPAAGSNR